MKLGLLIAAALALPYASSATAPPATSAPPAVPTTEVPILFEDGRVYVEARANGGAPGWYILDTGATATIVDARIAERLKLPKLSADRASGAGAGFSTSSRTSGATLDIHGIELGVREPLIMDLAGLLAPTSGLAPAGLIGSQFFAEHVVEMDFQSRRMRVWPRDADLSGRYDRSVPLEFTGGTPIARARLGLPSGGAIDAKVLVDLGAKSTLLLPEPFIDRHRLRAAFPAARKMALGAGVGGNTFYAFARAPSLSLTGDPALAITAPTIGLSVGGTLRSTWHEGLLGADFLARFKVAFDYSRSRLLLTRVTRTPEPVDMSGLFVTLLGDRASPRFIVREVMPGGPGEQAGIAAGDELTAIAGRAAATLTLAEIRTLLKSGPGKRVPLTLKRKKRNFSAAVQLKQLL